MRVTFKHEFLEGFITLVDNLTKQASEFKDDEYRLMLAGLYEIRQRFKQRELRPQDEYTLTLTPVQALSVRFFYNSFINEHTTYMGIHLLRWSNEASKLYQ